MKFYNNYNKPKHIKSNIDYDTKVVQQSEADVVGLKYQLQRYGMNTLLSKFESMKSKFGYADCTVIPDFETLQNRVSKGVEYFQNLPSEIRDKFKNKPSLFYKSIEDDPVQAVKDGYINDNVSEYIKSIYPDKFNTNDNVIKESVGTVEPANISQEDVNA